MSILVGFDACLFHLDGFLEFTNRIAGRIFRGLIYFFYRHALLFQFALKMELCLKWDCFLPSTVDILFH